MATYLYIEDTLVDLFDEGSIPIVQNIADIANLSGGSTKGSYSIPFKVPATKANKQLFYFPELATNESFDSEVEKSARLEVDGTVILDGVARIRETVKNGQLIEYNITLYDNNSNWINAIKGKTLNELDFSEYDHIWNKANIDASENLFDSTFYTYGVFNYGAPAGGSGYNVVDRLPNFRVWKIFNKIFQDAGYQVSSTFLNDVFFKRLFITAKNSPTISEDLANDSKFRVSLQSASIPARKLLAGVFKQIPLDNAVDVGDQIYFNTKAGDFTLGANSSFTSAITAKMAFELELGIQTVKESAFKLAPIKSSEVTAVIYVNEIPKTSRTFNIEGLTTTNNSNIQLVNWTTTSFKVNKGDEIKIRLTTNLLANVNGVDVSQYIVNGTKLSNNVFTTIVEGMTAEIATMMPEHTQLDWISDIKEMFNLYFYTDEINKVVRIEPRDEFYAQTAIDWSTKLDKSEPITISHLGNDLQKEIRFRYKDDSKDEHVDNKERDLLDGEPLASLEVSITNVNAKDGTRDKGLKTMAPTWVNRGLVGAPSAYIPIMWKTDNNTMPRVRTFDFDTRILYYNGVRSLANDEKWNFEGDIRGTYPQFLMQDDTSLNDNSLYFGDSPFTSGLYQKHWRNSIETINESRLWECTLYLDALDIQNLDFRVPVYIEDGGDGNYFHIRKIEYDAARFGKVKAELVKVINPVPRVQLTEDKNDTTYKFVPVTQPVEEQYITTIINDVEVDVYGDSMEVVGGVVVGTGGTNKLPYDG